MKTGGGIFVIWLIAAAAFWPLVASAASDSRVLTVNSTVSPRATLILSTNTISFPDADPDSTPSIQASQNPVSVTARVRTGSNSTATLQVQAAGDLTSGSNTISVSAITWTSTGAGFVGGTMNTAPQAVGSWNGPGERIGSLSFALANSWLYATGTYSTSITYTLTAP